MSEKEKLNTRGFSGEVKGGFPWCLDSAVKNDAYMSNFWLFDHSAKIFYPLIKLTWLEILTNQRLKCYWMVKDLAGHASNRHCVQNTIQWDKNTLFRGRRLWLHQRCPIDHRYLRYWQYVTYISSKWSYF